MLPVVSIVGRPNVGKSTLFNRLIGTRKAIVHDEYGVTRDRHYGESFWNGRDFTVIDTGGYLPDEMNVMVVGIREQVHIALEESDVILFVVDVKDGINTLDKAVANLLRQQDKPVLLVSNKADNEERRMNSTEFYELGIEDLFPVSSINGTGTGNLLDRVVELLPEEEEPEEENDIPKLAFIGRPNVGKSSLFNALLNDERAIVTDIAGTTRDSINSNLEYDGKEYLLVDTAGLRKRTKVKENIEFYSTIRTDRAIRECDIAILIVDAMQGFDAQDKRVIREAEKFNKGLVIVLNKWDLVPEKDTNTVREFEDYIYTSVPQLYYVPIVTISALNKTRIHRVLDVADEVIAERRKEISTPDFNDFLEQMLGEKPLPMKRGQQLKITYATQVKSNPPVFKFFMNSPHELPPNYRKYIENKIRERFGFLGVPITMVFRQK
ncbi:MAG: ribosome biogenesis GTPase Der [Gracilimonas sp.]|uniref:ribosome biogenesis GTPase Der n=1 Tax=Gracilimonas TaxID=649462 RepID=UPI001AFE76BB|nr:ribosome biogenesis GTPase Der [Gracilimonas sp.]MBO6586419.1 ribosome biogenesis GTPase Der [Gracilimonas sp.]MBO6615076.1 ribosome biogenesis GTPase Der [Gracilimonas sp.]